MLALGNMHPACHGLVLTESMVLADDYLDRQMARVRLAMLLSMPRLGARLYKIKRLESPPPAQHVRSLGM